MTTRKRVRGFGSTQVVHAKRAVHARKVTAQRLREAVDYLRKGNCVMARTAYEMAWMWYGDLGAHVQSLRQRSRPWEKSLDDTIRLRRTLLRMGKRIETACVARRDVDRQGR